MTDRENAILIPILVQILLTMVMFVALGIAKARAARRGEVNLERRALHADAWPDSVIKINNNIRNQFEVPVLFFVLVMVLWLMNSAGLAAQLLAWAFVVSRGVHAYIHTGSNHVPARRATYLVGCLIVLIMLGMAFWSVLVV